jgi:hypothetical protein
MPWTPNTALRAGASVAALASGALLLAACGSHSSGSAAPDAKSSAPASASSAAAASGGAAAMEAYRDCLARHGVKLPGFSPGAHPSGRPSGGFRGGFGRGTGGASADPETQKAAQACASVRPTFHGPGGPGGADSSAIQAFKSCLKDHGVTLPSTSPTSTTRPRGGGGFFGPALDTSDPKVSKAYDTCKPLLPGKRQP